MANVTLRFMPRWWLRWYLAGVLLMTWVTGLPPNKDRLSFWVMRGIKIKVV